jgi:hypothetical protein
LGTNCEPSHTDYWVRCPQHNWGLRQVVSFDIINDAWAEEVFRQMVVYYVYFLPVITGHPTSGLQAKFILMCTLDLSTL